MSKPTDAADQQEFEAIEEAVLASPKGRWFLQEFSRRNRSADTNRLLDAIEKLYERAAKAHESVQLDLVYRELSNTYATLQDTRNRIATLRASNTNEIDDPAETSARAAADISSAAKSLQKIADHFRSHGMDADLCDEMDTHVAGIFMSGSYQELIAKRVETLSEGLIEFEKRLSAILDLWTQNDFSVPPPRN